MTKPTSPAPLDLRIAVEVEHGDGRSLSDPLEPESGRELAARSHDELTHADVLWLMQNVDPPARGGPNR